jgi:hypothetical protein
MRAHMTRVIRHRAKAVAFALLAAMPIAAATGAEAQSLDSIIQAQASADREAAAAQERIGQLNDKANDAAAQYRQALADVDSLTRFNAQLDKQVKSQSDEIALIQRQLGEIDTTQREIQPLMQKMVDTLVKFVDLDVPFLIEERKGRVARLQEIMPRARLRPLARHVSGQAARRGRGEDGRVRAARPRVADVPDARRERDRVLEPEHAQVGGGRRLQGRGAEGHQGGEEDGGP